MDPKVGGGLRMSIFSVFTLVVCNIIFIFLKIFTVPRNNCFEGVIPNTNKLVYTNHKHALSCLWWELLRWHNHLLENLEGSCHGVLKKGLYPILYTLFRPLPGEGRFESQASMLGALMENNPNGPWAGLVGLILLILI